MQLVSSEATILSLISSLGPGSDSRSFWDHRRRFARAVCGGGGAVHSGEAQSEMGVKTQLRSESSEIRFCGPRQGCL